MEIKNSTLLWIGVGAVGAYLLLKKKDSSPVTSTATNPEPKKIKLPVEPIVPETPSEMARPKEDYLPVDLGLGAGGPPPPYEGAYYVDPIMPDYRLPEYSFNPIDEYVYNRPVYKTQVEPIEYPYSYSTSVAERQINQPIYL